ncbi:MAG TPA: ABC transporter permease [Gaiellaceae bacterium]|jgi:peptide/nickel transport system permease protein|nr:ABC transporter permease [Gaiellaceae bacterium]
MRWFLRRLVFYVFAVWVALTLNFLLPRLMPGDPIGGVLQRLSPAQIAANPGIVQTYQALLGGGKGTIWHDYVVYLHRLVHLNFGISTSNYPAPVSEVIGRTLPYSIALVGVAFLLAFVIGTTVGMIAAWRRGGGFDTFVVPSLMALGAFPAFFTALLGVYFLGLKLQWFPIQHAYDSGLVPGLNWAFLSSAVRHAELPLLIIIAAFTGGWVLNMRAVMITTISEDYVAMARAKGLRDRRVMTRYAGRNAILPPLNGFAAQFAGAVGGLVFIEYVFSYPGAGLTLQQAALGNDYPLTQGLLLVFSLCVIAANFIMDLLNFLLDPRVRTS